MTPAAPKRGRPRLSPKQRKRNNVTLRLRDELKQQLAERADANGRSLSEEMEYRLELAMSPSARWLRWWEEERWRTGDMYDGAAKPVKMSEREQNSLLDKASCIAIFDASVGYVQVALEIDGSRTGKFFDHLDQERWGRMTPERRRILLEDYYLFETHLQDEAYRKSPRWRRESREGHARLERDLAALGLTRKLSSRARNCLWSAEVWSLDELVTKTEAEMLRRPNLGKKTLAEIREFLADAGLSMRGPQ